MRRKLFITGIVASITFVVTVFVAYGKEIFTTSVSPLAAATVAANQTRQNAGTNEPDEKHKRNLALQPEALKLSRRIGGSRFRSKTAPVLIVQGTLKTDSDSQPVTIIRRQSDDGEQVEVTLGGNRLAWAKDSGPQNRNGALNQPERLLLERLTYDTVDQFILAQLRGASYSVVLQNLRPDDAGDDYTGPLWDVVRVDDPEPDEQKRPLSTWRLYYINRTTGLIDKIVSDVLGERIEAQLSEWTERNGEKCPATITWSRGGQTLMTLNLINVSSASN